MKPFLFGAFLLSARLAAPVSDQEPIKPAAPVTAAAAPVLAPGAVLRFEFPELSDNMVTLFDKDKFGPNANVLVAELPANYRADRHFPIVVYLDGGNGGVVLSPKRLREALGPDDYIVVRLPLFKKERIPSDPAGGRAILTKDFDVIRRNYRVMLQKLFDAVPNITRAGSTLGGFSNGAHTTGVLLEGKDDFILSHFDHFYMVEGGIRQFRGEALRNPALKACRFLLLLGDRGGPDPFAGMAAPVVTEAKAAGLDVVALPMRGYGHEIPLDYLKLLHPWLRKEPLPNVPPKPQAPPSTSPAEPPRPAPLASTSASGKSNMLRPMGTHYSEYLPVLSVSNAGPLTTGLFFW